jgi:hypothetical protein
VISKPIPGCHSSPKQGKTPANKDLRRASTLMRRDCGFDTAGSKLYAGSLSKLCDGLYG